MSPVAVRSAVALAALTCVAAAATQPDAGTRWVALLFVPCVAAGAVIAWRVPGNATGAAVAWSGSAIALQSLWESLALRHVVPWNDGTWPINLGGLLWLLLVFPDGRLPRAGRSILGAAGLALGLTLTGMRGGTRVDGQVVLSPSAPEYLTPIGAVLVAGCLLAAIVTQVRRYRRADDDERDQLRWLLLAGIGVVVLLVLGWLLEAPLGTDVAYWPFLTAIVVLVPAAVVVAIVRHDLFDIDELLGQSAAWFLTLIAAAAVYAAVVLVAGRMAVDGAGVSPLLGAVVAALLLLPLHGLLLRWIGGFVDRDRQRGMRLVDQFIVEMRAGRRSPEDVGDVLRRAQGDPDLRLLLVTVDGIVDLAGHLAVPGAAIEVVAGDEIVGYVELGHTTARAKRRAIRLATAAWAPIEVVRLRSGLRASRERLARESGAVRKQVERDLHDGAQQRILATGMRLRLAQRRAQPDVAVQLGIAVDELEEIVAELRRLAHGVRPTRLDDGLVPALATIGESSPVPIRLVVRDLPELDEQRSLCAYLVVAEAVANVLKHAAATSVDVSLDAQGRRLRIVVADDGIGGVESAERLVSLRDRVESIGGSLSVDSRAGVGTAVEAVI